MDGQQVLMRLIAIQCRELKYRAFLHQQHEQHKLQQLQHHHQYQYLIQQHQQVASNATPTGGYATQHPSQATIYASQQHQHNQLASYASIRQLGSLNQHLTSQASAAVLAEPAAIAAAATLSQQQHFTHNDKHQLNQVHQAPSNQSLNEQDDHQAVSLPDRKYQCKMCPQVFMSKAEMKYHNQNHMREAKPYKCSQCPKAFANSSYLSQHMRIHQGVKPYSCDTCSRKFTQLSHLQQHKRTHTGDKPYKCSHFNCTKQFSQLSNLQSHSRSHQLDKPFKCNSCYKCFHDEQSLLEHIPRHLKSKHLKKNLCVFCGSSYQHERGLVKHFQQNHTDKTPELVAAAIATGTTGNMQLIGRV